MFKKRCLKIFSFALIGVMVTGSFGVSTKAANFVGISNIGNSCYLNALLQQLYHTENFKSAILNFKITDPKRQKTIFNLQNIFRTMKDCKNECGTVNVGAFVKQLGPDVYNGSCKDSHEINTILIKRCDSEHPSDKNYFSNLFNNNSCTEVFCSSCNKKISQNSVMELCMDLTPAENLKKMVINSSESEKVPDRKCELCNKKDVCSIREKIQGVGQTRVVNLGRYRFLKGRMAKVNDKIEFDESYNFESDSSYALNGVIIHTGGHYFSYVKDHKANQWYVLNDARAAKVGDFGKIKEKCFGNGKISTNATVLFYQKVV